MPNLAGGRNSDQTLKKSSWCGVARPGSFRNKQFREPHACIPRKVRGHIGRNKRRHRFPDGLRISWYKAPSSPFPRSPGIGWSARSVDIPKPVVHRRTIEYPMIRRPAFADSAAIQAAMTAVVSTAEGSIQVRKQTADRNRISRLGLPADGPGYLRGRPMWLD